MTRSDPAGSTTSAGGWACRPEVPDAVRALARHVRIVVVANADHDYLMRCLDHNGLRFDLVVDSETARCYKPDLPIFRRACEALPVPASEAVMVGDTPETDVQGAPRPSTPRARSCTRSRSTGGACRSVGPGRC